MDLNLVSDDLARILRTAGVLAANRGGTLDPIDLVQAILAEAETMAEEIVIEAAIDPQVLQDAADTIRLAHA